MNATRYADANNVLFAIDDDQQYAKSIVQIPTIQRDGYQYVDDRSGVRKATYSTFAPYEPIKPTPAVC
jgi:hypothetical protein